MDKDECWQASQAPTKSRRRFKGIKISDYFIESMRYEVAMVVCSQLNAISRYLNILLPPSQKSVGMHFQVILRPAVMIKVRVDLHESSDLKKIFLRDVLEEFKKRNNNNDIDQVSRHMFNELVENHIKETQDQEDILYENVIKEDLNEKIVKEMPLSNKNLISMDFDFNEFSD